MNQLNPAYLCGISYEIGRLCPIEELQIEGDSVEIVNILLEKGLRTYSKLEEPVSGIIQRCCKKTLDTAGLRAEDIDGVLFVTESFDLILEKPIYGPPHPLRNIRDRLVECLIEIGIEKASFFCSSFGGSGNFLQAVSLGMPLVETGRIHNLLMVCIDCHPPGVSRYLPQSLSVTGDGIATCAIVSTPKAMSMVFEIEYVLMVPFNYTKHLGDISQRMLDTYRIIKYAAAKCYEFTDRQPHEFEWLILNNYNELVSKIFAHFLDFRIEQTYLNNLTRTGHISCCDPPINLSDLFFTSSLANGTPLMIYCGGTTSCGLISLVLRC